MRHFREPTADFHARFRRVPEGLYCEIHGRIIGPAGEVPSMNSPETAAAVNFPRRGFSLATCSMEIQREISVAQATEPVISSPRKARRISEGHALPAQLQVCRLQAIGCSAYCPAEAEYARALQDDGRAHRMGFQIQEPARVAL